MLDNISTKKEMFVLTLKGATPIIRNIEIGNEKSKKKQKKLTQLMNSVVIICGI
jgi:hypothetical protein